MRTVLTIAGSDPSGGAGIQRDLKTFEALGVFGTTAITAITVQDTVGVSSVTPIAAPLVAAQIDAVLGDMGADAIKIGMLARADIVTAVADALARHGRPPIVADTIIAASDGHRLLDDAGVEMMRRRLLLMVDLVTPNAAEAEILTRLSVRTLDEQRRAAQRIVELGARAALVKGGHVPGDVATDVLWDGHAFHEFSRPRLADRSVHGTGCALSAAIAARLAHGDDLVSAIQAAKTFVTTAIDKAVAIGRGRRVLASIY